MVKRKLGNSHTTICITWADKEEFRKFARLVKKTKNGDMYESDSAVLRRMLSEYSERNIQQSLGESHETYPRKSTSQGQDQQG